MAEVSEQVQEAIRQAISDVQAEYEKDLDRATGWELADRILSILGMPTLEEMEDRESRFQAGLERIQEAERGANKGRDEVIG